MMILAFMTGYDLLFSKYRFEAVSKFLAWVGLLTFMKAQKNFPETRQKMHPPCKQITALSPVFLWSWRTAIWTWRNTYTAPAAAQNVCASLKTKIWYLHYVGQWCTSSYVTIKCLYGAWSTLSWQKAVWEENRHQDTGWLNYSDGRGLANRL